MNKLIKLEVSNENQVVVSSRQVAGSFGKEHKHVLATIQDILAAENSATTFFMQTTYENRGKQYPEYLMNRDGFSLLVMGFTGKDALQWKLKYIQAFNEMEQAVRSKTPQTFSQALRLAAEQAELLEQQSKQLEEQAPKVLFAKSVEASQTSCLVGELAKILKQNGVNIGQNRAFAWLRQNGYLIKSGENRNLPTQRSMEMKLMEIKKNTVSNPDGSVRVTRTTKVTGKGQIYFVNLFMTEHCLQVC